MQEEMKEDFKIREMEYFPDSKIISIIIIGKCKAINYNSQEAFVIKSIPLRKVGDSFFKQLYNCSTYRHWIEKNRSTKGD